MHIKLFINNEERETQCINIKDLAAELQLPERGVALALNNRVVQRADWAGTSLSDGDKITIIKAAFGG